VRCYGLECAYSPNSIRGPEGEGRRVQASAPCDMPHQRQGIHSCAKALPKIFRRADYTANMTVLPKHASYHPLTSLKSCIFYVMHSFFGKVCHFSLRKLCSVLKEFSVDPRLWGKTSQDHQSSRYEQLITTTNDSTRTKYFFSNRIFERSLRTILR